MKEENDDEDSGDESSEKSDESINNDEDDLNEDMMIDSESQSVGISLVLVKNHH